MYDGDTVAWFCIDELLRASRSHAADPDHQQAVHLAIIASASSVSLKVLPRMLDVVLGELIESEREGQKDVSELVIALFEEIAQRVGDAEKECAMRWWDNKKSRLQKAVSSTDGTGSRRKDKGRMELASRL